MGTTVNLAPSTPPTPPTPSTPSTPRHFENAVHTPRPRAMPAQAPDAPPPHEGRGDPAGTMMAQFAAVPGESRPATRHARSLPQGDSAPEPDNAGAPRYVNYTYHGPSLWDKIVTAFIEAFASSGSADGQPFNVNRYQRELYATAMSAVKRR